MKAKNKNVKKESVSLQDDTTEKNIAIKSAIGSFDQFSSKVLFHMFECLKYYPHFKNVRLGNLQAGNWFLRRKAIRIGCLFVQKRVKSFKLKFQTDFGYYKRIYLLTCSTEFPKGG